MESDAAQSVDLYKLWGWYETNKKQVVWGATAVVGVALVVWFVIYQKNEKEIAASEALANVSAAQLATPGGRSDSAAAYAAIADKYPNSSAGARAQLLAAAALFSQGQYDQSLSQFQKFIRDHADSPLTGEAQLGIAASLDAKGKPEDAIKAYKDLVDHRANDVVAPQAKFSLARLYAAQGKFDQARSLYEDVERTDPYGSLAPEAGMRVEELVSKHPELAAKPVAPTAPAMTIEKNK